MKNIWLGTIFISVLACTPSGQQSTTSTDAPSTQDTVNDTPTQQECTYILDTDKVTIGWTAYKTTDKIAVKGVFDTITIADAKEAADLPHALESITLIINATSINSQNPERDARIVKFFFGTMNSWEKIIGDVVAVQGDENRGELALDLSLNGITRQIMVPYVQERGTLVFQTEIDLSEWNADSSIASLNRACHDLHTGPDGISKLWPTIRFEVRAPFHKKCP